ncbi:alanine racemase [Schaalia sp. Marseille-Q2122]|uniref:alanine racemase n=1 Tax=Schaalia sp. Marseille-Q2122 TaxID=2736604 RepID=UPI0020CA7606|nr:alanine racemase [Schaalia sp. Marseille-Q2122]
MTTPCPAQTYPGRAVINHAAITQNLRVLRRLAPACLQMAIVKGDAYGHGLLPVSLTALDAGADYLGVAQVQEAISLREGLDSAGIPRSQAKIFTWINHPEDDWRRAIDADLELSVSSTAALAQICATIRAIREEAEAECARWEDQHSNRVTNGSANGASEAYEDVDAAFTHEGDDLTYPGEETIAAPPRHPHADTSTEELPLGLALKREIKARIHIKIDTGMSRAGATLDELPALASAARMAKDAGLITVVGAWSHLSRADDLSHEGRESTASHLRYFEAGLTVLEAVGITPQIRHIAATSGLLWHPDTHYDMVRPGIGLYGLSPDPEEATSADLGLQPVMTLMAPLTSVKIIEADAPVSYGGTWRAPSRRWVGIVPLGYADGIIRAVSNKAPVCVNAATPLRTQIVGRVCMDQFMIDLGPAPESAMTSAQAADQAPALVGDTVILFGKPDENVPSADEWALAADTINYEIVCRVGERVPRSHIVPSMSWNNVPAI